MGCCKVGFLIKDNESYQVDYLTSADQEIPDRLGLLKFHFWQIQNFKFCLELSIPVTPCWGCRLVFKSPIGEL